MENTWPILAGYRRFIYAVTSGIRDLRWGIFESYLHVDWNGDSWIFFEEFVWTGSKLANDWAGFLWGGRAGRLLGGPNLKETFLVYPCLRCVLSGAQLPPSKWDSLSFSRPPRPFQRFIIGRWSFLVDSNHRCWLENRKGAAREGVLVRFSIRDKSANNALPPPAFSFIAVA